MAVCIPAHGDAETLARTLASLRRLDHASLEVVVAVDGPDPTLEATAREAAATVVVLPSNQGSYAARNAAVAQLQHGGSQAHVVCFLDADVTVTPGWLEAHLRALAEADLSGGAVRFSLSTPPTPAEHVDASRHMNQQRYIEELGFSATANLAVRREVMEALRFDEGMTSAGDRDFSNRARRAGFRLVYAPQAAVTHPARARASSLLRKVDRIARGTSALRRTGRPVDQAASYRRESVVASARRLGRSRGWAWEWRALLLDRLCDLVWAVRVPGAVVAGVRRRLRGRRRQQGQRPTGVLIIVENLPVPLDRRVWMEALTLQRAGYAVTVICPTGAGFTTPREECDGVLILRHPLPVEGRGVLAFVREYAAALWWEHRLARVAWRERPYRVVHICNPPDLLFLVAGWLRLTRGARVLFDHHDLFPEMYLAKYGRQDLLYRLIRLAERLTMATAHRVITTNQTGVERATGRGGKAPELVHLVGSGPDLDRFTLLPPDQRHRAGRRFLVGYVGILGDQDGGDLLVEAVDRVVHQHGRDDVHFMIIGGGPALPDLQTDAVRRGLGDHVEFTGMLPENDVRARLSSADICVDPEPVNGYSEYCTTNKVLEYMALGKPVVLFDRLEGRRSAGPAGVYAAANDPSAMADAIVALLTDPVRRARLGAAGRERVEQHLSWQHQRQALLDAYEALLATSP